MSKTLDILSRQILQGLNAEPQPRSENDMYAVFMPALNERFGAAAGPQGAAHARLIFRVDPTVKDSVTLSCWDWNDKPILGFDVSLGYAGGLDSKSAEMGLRYAARAGFEARLLTQRRPQ